MGTTSFLFERLIHSLDKAMSEFDERLVLQGEIGNYKISYPHTTIYKEINYKKMIYYLSRARAIVCHGGAGTLLLAMRYATVKSFVLPRLAKFKEHIDDHQLYFSEYMCSRGFIVLPSGEKRLVEDLHAYIQRPPAQIKKINSDHQNLLVTCLREFSEN